MELSPKQQAVNEIKNAKNLLILGHSKPDGDQLGSILGLKEALEKLQKSVTIVVSDPIAKTFSFLPGLSEIKREYKHTDGKILRIDTKRVPIDGMKWHKDDQYLDIHLDTQKNLKFEFIEIINGLPKPDLIIVLDTAHVADIEKIYEQNEKLFLETPVLNIDHHPGNEYFGTINLVDLTATSTAEILVSLFEALGIKIDNPDMATCLLTGILFDTQSFRSLNTTPKSLTVAAQLLAAGGRQQEIVKNLYSSGQDELLNLWQEIVKNIETDENHQILWSTASRKVSGLADLEEATDELLIKNPGYSLALLFAPLESEAGVQMVARSTDPERLSSVAKIFKGAEITNNGLSLQLNEPSIDDAKKSALKRIAESGQLGDGTKKQLWDVIEQPSVEAAESLRERGTTKIDIPNSVKEKEDAIEEALKSISQAEKDENRREMESLREVIDRKRADSPNPIGDMKASEETDIFEDE